MNAGTAVDIGAYEASSTYQVTSSADTDDPGTLRAAIGWADSSQNFNPANIATPAPNTIVFTTTQPITLSNGVLSLSNTTTPIAISGPGASTLTISGGNASQVFVVASGTTASISGLTITGGAALGNNGGSGSGGAIDNSGTLTLSFDAITGSSAINGGGFSNEAGAVATLSYSTVSNNSGTTGGGVYNAGTLKIADSTIAGNSASVEGGGVANFGTLTAISTTIAQNNVASGGAGGGLFTSGGKATLYDTIVAQNTVGSITPATYSDISGTIAPASAYNLIGTAGNGGLTSANSNILVSDSAAGLGTLTSNQGTTQTISLLTGSPAIGAGTAKITGVTIPVTDQRGSVRPVAAYDIGAYQSGAFNPVPEEITLYPAIRTVTTNTAKASTTTSTTPVVVTTTVPVPVVTKTTTTDVTTPPKTTSKVKVKTKVTSKKAHPGAGSATKFHKAAATKTKKPAVAAKAHPSAAKKKK